ncbi:MAG: phytanoyl-CoA dioxygenase family protein [Aeromicrobium sp.]|uniref:phytanoyl-CoA dioxygenase family protein n=1 Tax=Aeromicrobium sp. TaxID=1871063 RepID=UPI0039E3EC88
MSFADIVPMTADQRETFERDGFLVIPGVLSSREVSRYESAVDGVYAEREAAGRLGADKSLHQLSAVASCPELAGLVNHPRVFGLVTSMLGWNCHVYHSHFDIHPPIREPKPFRFEWHQDGGRQNREIETDPRPRLSVKLAFWLSDVSEPGRGNFKVVKGSHETNRIDGPPRRDIEWPDPEGAMEVCANPGDAVFFDRRIWHARSNNYSDIVRKGVFFGYTPRWITVRDEAVSAEVAAGLTPVQRQLLSALDEGRVNDPVEGGDHAWGHFPDEVPLYGFLRERGLLDSSIPALIP